MMTLISAVLIAAIVGGAIAIFSLALLQPRLGTRGGATPPSRSPGSSGDACRLPIAEIQRAEIADWLPNSRKLMDLSIQEVGQLRDNFRRDTAAFAEELAAGEDASEGLRLDQIRQALVEAASRYRHEHEAAANRVANRHHSQGPFGVLGQALCVALLDQAEHGRLWHQQLIEVAGELNLSQVRAGLASVMAAMRDVQDDFTVRLDAVRECCQALGTKRGNARWTKCEQYPRRAVQEHLKEALTRNWLADFEDGGPVAIAHIDANQIVASFPGFDLTSAAQMLHGMAMLLTDDEGGRCDRAAIEVETELVDPTGRPRAILWTCTLVENAAGQIVSLIAAGRERGGASAIGSADCGLSKVAGGPALSEVAQSTSPERRQRRRVAFPHVQLVAPAAGDWLPPLSEFSELLCHDISTGGISFLVGTVPSAAFVVVALGNGAPHIYMRARLVHCQRQDLAGEAMYLVGCQFVGRALVFGPDQGMFVFGARPALGP